MKFRVSLLLAAVLGAALAACEQQAPDPLAQARVTCNVEDSAPADRVAACTKMLDEGALQGPVRAAALANRSEAHLAGDERT
ncbi:MAG: hypothetical protein ABUS57_19375, partial [Pseudomonadota bacterium]